MKASIRVPALLVLSVPLGLAATSAAQNAAVKYLRADIALRQSYPLAPDEASNLEKRFESPLTDDDQQLVVAAEEALREFDHGAELNSCDWNISVEDGPLANTAHRGAIRELVAVSGIRARLRFRDRDTQRAMEDTLAAITAARHLSLDGSLTSVLIGYSLENKVVIIISRNMDLFSTTQLRQLATRIDALPSGSNLANALKAEKVNRNDLLPIVRGRHSRDELVNGLLSEVPYLSSNPSLASEIIDGCGGSASGFVNCINEQQAFYDAWASRFQLKPDQFERYYESEFESLSKTNPIVRLLTPNLARFRWADAYTETRRALLRAAIAVRQDGSSALISHTDPYDGEPFSYAAFDNGFRLESRLKESGKPLSLEIVSDLAETNGVPK